MDPLFSQDEINKLLNVDSENFKKHRIITIVL